MMILTNTIEETNEFWRTMEFWISLLAPVIFNGILLTIFESKIEKSTKREEKRNELRDKTIIEFWEILQELNSYMLTGNMAVQKNEKSLAWFINGIQDRICKIVQYYDTNSYDLSLYKNEYNKWLSSWEDFNSLINELHEKNLNEMDRIELGGRLQKFKEENIKFIGLVREKY